MQHAATTSVAVKIDSVVPQYNIMYPISDAAKQITIRTRTHTNTNTHEPILTYMHLHMHMHSIL